MFSTFRLVIRLFPFLGQYYPRWISSFINILIWHLEAEQLQRNTHDTDFTSFNLRWLTSVPNFSQNIFCLWLTIWIIILANRCYKKLKNFSIICFLINFGLTYTCICLFDFVFCCSWCIRSLIESESVSHQLCHKMLCSLWTIAQQASLFPPKILEAEYGVGNIPFLQRMFPAKGSNSSLWEKPRKWKIQKKNV